MTAKRAEEPFRLAYRLLRLRLSDGACPPGARLTALDAAAGLGVSPTPVREALSRLAGEGLLEDRRGQGFFVPHPGATDIAHLYRLNLACLSIAAAPSCGALEVRAAAQTLPPLQDEGAVRWTERLFEVWVRRGGGRALWRTHRAVQAQLGPVRRLEPQIMPDLDAEARSLAEPGLSSSRAATLRRLRAFHVRRVRLSARLAALLQACADPRCEDGANAL